MNFFYNNNGYSTGEIYWNEQPIRKIYFRDNAIFQRIPHIDIILPCLTDENVVTLEGETRYWGSNDSIDWKYYSRNYTLNYGIQEGYTEEELQEINDDFDSFYNNYNDYYGVYPIDPLISYNGGYPNSIFNNEQVINLHMFNMGELNGVNNEYNYTVIDYNIEDGWIELEWEERNYFIQLNEYMEPYFNYTKIVKLVNNLSQMVQLDETNQPIEYYWFNYVYMDNDNDIKVSIAAPYGNVIDPSTGDIYPNEYLGRESSYYPLYFYCENSSRIFYNGSPFGVDGWGSHGLFLDQSDLTQGPRYDYVNNADALSLYNNSKYVNVSFKRLTEFNYYGGFCPIGSLKQPLNLPYINNLSGTYSYYTLLEKAWCGNYVTNMHATYQYCPNITKAVCGDRVEDFTYAYASCYNLRGKAVCGNNVQRMEGAYWNCYNLTKAVCGDNVLDMTYAYYNCYNLGGSAACGNNVRYMIQAYYYCNHLMKANCSDSVYDMGSAYDHCTNLIEADCGNNVIFMNYAYRDCWNLKNAVCGDNVEYMIYAYKNCYNLLKAACGNKVKNMQYAYENCYNLVDAACSDSVVNMWSAYNNCYNLVNAACGNNITELYSTYSNCQKLRKAACGENVTSMYNTYYNCISLTDAVCGNNVVYMDSTYSGCINLINAACGDNVREMQLTYSNCHNLRKAECGNNVLNMSYTYPDCYELENAVCGDKVRRLYRTYQNCWNLKNAVCGDNVREMDATYSDCYNLTGDAVCGDNVINMNNAYQNCFNLNGNAACGNNVINMPYTYENCYSLTGDAACGENVVVMYRTYSNCYNLNGNAACGDKVTNFNWTYSNCHNLKKAVCGNNVINMYSTYRDCHNLTEAACGENVNSFSGVYANCYNLINAVCGANVTDMGSAYQNCSNLINAVCGDRVNRMTYTYANCHNLIDAVCGPVVYQMDGAYSNCWNLVNPACTYSVLVMPWTYADCYSIINAVCGGQVYDMRGAYMNCHNLINAACGANVTDMGGAYQDCWNLKNAVCGNRVFSLNNAYQNCYNLEYPAPMPYNVQYADRAYLGCHNLREKVIGPRVNLMNQIYDNNCPYVTDVQINMGSSGLRKVNNSVFSTLGLDSSSQNHDSLQNINMFYGPDIYDLGGNKYVTKYNNGKFSYNQAMGVNFNAETSFKDFLCNNLPNLKHITFSPQIRLVTALFYGAKISPSFEENSFTSTIQVYSGTFAESDAVKTYHNNYGPVIMTRTYENCINLTGELYIPSTAEWIYGIAKNCSNLTSIKYNRDCKIPCLECHGSIDNIDDRTITQYTINGNNYYLNYTRKDYDTFAGCTNVQDIYFSNYTNIVRNISCIGSNIRNVVLYNNNDTVIKNIHDLYDYTLLDSVNHALNIYVPNSTNENSFNNIIYTKSDKVFSMENPLTWTSLSNGYYNEQYNIYVYNDYDYVNDQYPT